MNYCDSAMFLQFLKALAITALNLGANTLSAQKLLVGWEIGSSPLPTGMPLAISSNVCSTRSENGWATPRGKDAPVSGRNYN